MNLIFVSLFNNLQEISSVDEGFSHLLKQFSRLPSHLKEEKLGQIKLLLEGNCSLVEMKMPSVQEIPRGKGRPVGALNKKRKIIPESSTRRESSKFEIIEGLAPGFKKRGRPPGKKTETPVSNSSSSVTKKIRVVNFLFFSFTVYYHLLNNFFFWFYRNIPLLTWKKKTFPCKKSMLH